MQDASPTGVRARKPASPESRVLFITVMLLVTAAVTAGCSREDPAASVVPAHAALDVRFSLERGSAGSWSEARAVLRKVPVSALVEEQVPDRQQLLVQALAAVGIDGDGEVDWANDVEPWLGATGGVAAWPGEATGEQQSGDGDAPWHAVAWFESTDDAAARDAMEQATGTGAREQHGGHRYWVSEGEGRALVWTTIGRRLVVARSADAIHAAIDAVESGESIDDDGRWESLTEPRAGNAPLVQVYMASDGDRPAAALSAGVARRGLWIDATTQGSRVQSHDRDDAPTTREQLGRLPATTVAAQVGRPGREGGDALAHAAAALEASGVGVAVPAWLIPLADAVTGPDRRGAAVTADLTAIFAREGRLSVVRRAEGAGEDGVASSIPGSIAALNNALGGSGMRIQPSGDVRSGDGQVRRMQPIAVEGLPDRQLRRALALVGGSAGVALERSPALRPFVHHSAEGVLATHDGAQIVAVPEWGAHELVEARARSAAAGGTLEASRAFVRDLEAVDVPADATSLAWFDLRGLAAAIVAPVDARAAFVLDGQLAHVGGPVVWSESSPEALDSVDRTVIELPLY